LTAATTGLPQRSSRRNTRWPSSARAFPSTGPCAAISAMSAPATNALAPAPVSTTPRTAGSCSIWAIARSSSAMTAALSALSLSGRLMVMRAIAPVTS